MSSSNPWPCDDVRWAEHEYVHNPAYRQRLDRASPNCASAADPDQATVDAFCQMVSEWLWSRAPAFVAGCFFTVGAAWVWSFFL